MPLHLLMWLVLCMYSECGNHFSNKSIVSGGTKNHNCSGTFVKLVIFINHIHVYKSIFVMHSPEIVDLFITAQ